jgi:hypothetical protein
MAGRWGLAALVVAGAVLLPAGSPRAQSSQEKKRSEILKELGLEKKPVPPPAPPPPLPAEPGDEAAEKAGASGAAGAQAKGAKLPAAPSAPSFSRGVHPLLVATCKPCHAPGLPGGMTRLVLSGDAAADHPGVVRLVDLRNPEASVLLAKASGAAPHAGAAPWPGTSAQHQRLLAWIRGGARMDAAAAAPAAPTAAAVPAKPSAPGGTRAPADAAPASAAAPMPMEAVPARSPVPAPGPAVAGSKPAAPSFAADVHPGLMKSCALCHRPGGPAGMTRLSLTGDATKDEVAVRAFVDPLAPEQSALLTKAAGQMHAGGAVLPPGDVRYAAIVGWVRSLAPAASVTAPGASAGAPAAPEGAAPVAVAAAAPVPAAPAPAGPHGHGMPGGFALPLGFMLNGRFSLDYERRRFSGGPFEDGSVDALRSYHHFLFLSRDAAGEPCGLSVEVLTLQFWQAHCRVGGLPGAARLSFEAGKIVVPFGADPLFHQNYGGLGGFDQQVLPVIWAIEGAAGHLVVQRRGLALTDDLFLVRGYALSRADGILNLQNGFSADDDTKFGVGNRVGVSWMFASLWYSAYFNPLGFGRHLFMQALDLTVWRPRGVPVLEHFSFGLGLMRADVSGGGVGIDYYHFADYLQVRYHPTDWLYFQYRAGLRTFDNRRGLVLDKTRLTSADASAHNFALVARCAGLSAGLYYFINLEKVDEVANDLVRLNVTYEF